LIRQRQRQQATRLAGINRTHHDVRVGLVVFKAFSSRIKKSISPAAAYQTSIGMTQRTEGQTSANEPTDSVHFKPVPYFPVNRSYRSPPYQVWTLPSASRNREIIRGVIFVGDRQFGLSVLPIFDTGPGRGNAAPTDKPTSGEDPV
jgi:hypothetical protein